MAEVALHPSLKNSLMHHREETQVQRQRLESILQKHGANPQAHTDQAMQAPVTETAKMLSLLKDNDIRDAGLIASAQKLEHYEIAAYGTAAALAGQLKLADWLAQPLRAGTWRSEPSGGKPGLRHVRGIADVGRMADASSGWLLLFGRYQCSKPARQRNSSASSSRLRRTA
jgi:hypothetical protein